MNGGELVEFFALSRLISAPNSYPASNPKLQIDIGGMNISDVYRTLRCSAPMKKTVLNATVLRLELSSNILLHPDYDTSRADEFLPSPIGDINCTFNATVLETVVPSQSLHLLVSLTWDSANRSNYLPSSVRSYEELAEVSINVPRITLKAEASSQHRLDCSKAGHTAGQRPSVSVNSTIVTPTQTTVAITAPTVIVSTAAPSFGSSALPYLVVDNVNATFEFTLVMRFPRSRFNLSVRVTELVCESDDFSSCDYAISGVDAPAIALASRNDSLSIRRGLNVALATMPKTYEIRPSSIETAVGAVTAYGDKATSNEIAMNFKIVLLNVFKGQNLQLVSAALYESVDGMGDVSESTVVTTNITVVGADLLLMISKEENKVYEAGDVVTFVVEISHRARSCLKANNMRLNLTTESNVLLPIKNGSAYRLPSADDVALTDYDVVEKPILFRQEDDEDVFELGTEENLTVTLKYGIHEKVRPSAVYYLNATLEYGNSERGNNKASDVVPKFLEHSFYRCRAIQSRRCGGVSDCRSLCSQSSADSNVHQLHRRK